MTGAVSSQEQVHVERFGEDLFTIFNDSAIGRKATIRFEEPVKSCWELVEGTALEIRGRQVEMEVGAEEVRVVEVGR